MNQLCEICGREMVGDSCANWPHFVCGATPEEHRLCARVHELEAKLAESEAKVKELEKDDEALLAVLPEDFGAVEYIKYLEGEQNRIPDLVHENESLTAANAALEEKLAAAEDVLRAMASYVGNGGYNADTVDPKVFEAKIREGIDSIIRVEVNRALSDADTRAHAWWAHTGPHKSLREAIHNGTPAWVRDQEASRKKGAEHGE